MDQKTILVLNKICPFAERVWLTLEQKKVPYTLREVSLAEKQPFLTQTYHKAFGHDPTSDGGKVPILIDGDRILAESDLITWYLAQKYDTGTKLIPEDPFEKLRMRWFFQTHNNVIGTFYGFSGFKGKAKQDQDKHVAQLNQVLQEIENNITLPYALGESFTLADVLLYPWFSRWVAIQTFTGVKLDAKFTKIHDWLKNIQNRDSAKATIQSNQFYVQGYRKYFE